MAKLHEGVAALKGIPRDIYEAGEERADRTPAPARLVHDSARTPQDYDSSRTLRPRAGKVFVGMSGGVDSSVAALLLTEQGYDVTGVYMKNWSKDLPGMKCPWADDLADAKRVAVRLGIPFEVWDFEAEYYDKVVDYMLAEFKKGNTPNPDIMCNQEIKFKLFYEVAMEHGADFIATGHYARVGIGDSRAVACWAGGEWQGVTPAEGDPHGDSSTWGRTAGGRTPQDYGPGRTRPAEHHQLLRAVDENKDQTYFLYRISDEALAHTLFPIGAMLKPDVKKLAAEHHLHNAYKKESMGVCFVGEVGMKDFLKEYIDIRPGEIRDADTDKVLGVHEGAIFYTIGQRHGLYLSGSRGEVNPGLPYYVVRKDLEENIVYVSQNLNHTDLWTKELQLKDIVMRGGCGPESVETGDTCGGGSQRRFIDVREDSRRQDPSRRIDIQVRLRHRAPLIPATLENNILHFDTEIKRPAPGQSAVFYDGEVCLGGGIIAE